MWQRGSASSMGSTYAAVARDMSPQAVRRRLGAVVEPGRCCCRASPSTLRLALGLPALALALLGDRPAVERGCDDRRLPAERPARSRPSRDACCRRPSTRVPLAALGGPVGRSHLERRRRPARDRAGGVHAPSPATPCLAPRRRPAAGRARACGGDRRRVDGYAAARRLAKGPVRACLADGVCRCCCRSRPGRRRPAFPAVAWTVFAGGLLVASAVALARAGAAVAGRRLQAFVESAARTGAGRRPRRRSAPAPMLLRGVGSGIGLRLAIDGRGHSGRPRGAARSRPVEAAVLPARDRRRGLRRRRHRPAGSTGQAPSPRRRSSSRSGAAALVRSPAPAGAAAPQESGGARGRSRLSARARLQRRPRRSR